MLEVGFGGREGVGIVDGIVGDWIVVVVAGYGRENNLTRFEMYPERFERIPWLERCCSSSSLLYEIMT